MNTFNVFNIFLNIAYNRIYRRTGAFAVNTALRQRFFGVIKEKPRGVNYNLLTIALGYFITAQPATVLSALRILKVRNYKFQSNLGIFSLRRSR